MGNVSLKISSKLVFDTLWGNKEVSSHGRRNHSDTQVNHHNDAKMKGIIANGYRDRREDRPKQYD